jgi:nucleoside-diphosphate-sugar epimerase
MSKKQRIAVVTGGSGFIGSYVVEHLLEQGWTVRIIDNLSNSKSEDINPKAEFFELDIRDRNELSAPLTGADVLFHLAAIPSVEHSITHPDETHDINVNGSLNIFLAAKIAGIKRIVYSGSSAAYGEPTKLPTKEDEREFPLSPYGLQKLVPEMYLRMFPTLYGIETVTLRYFNVYGQRMKLTGAYASVISVFMRMRREGKPLTITGDGEQTRDFVHVRDVARANFLAATSELVGRGETINIGTGVATSVNQLAELFAGERIYIPARQEPKHALADISKAKELLHFAPQVTLQEGISELTG